MRRATLLGVLLATVAWGAVAAPAGAAGIGSHSQLHVCCTAPGVADRIFSEAKAEGASSIRVEIEVNGVFSTGPFGLVFTDWSHVDEVARLSRHYSLPVDGVLLGAPVPAAGCAAGALRCPPADPAAWGADAGAIAARYADSPLTTFEIWNEPDGAWAFAGTPQDYGRLLAAAFDGIKARAPSATVVLGGTMHSNAAGDAWLDQAFRTPGVGAAHKFDVGSIHLRGRIQTMVAQLRRRRAFFGSWQRAVPTWVTEHGYASTTRWQRDPAYKGGAGAQADYLSHSLPALAAAGSQETFVTLLDGPPGPYESEGIVAGRGRPGEALRRKPAWLAVRRAAARLPDGLPEK